MPRDAPTPEGRARGRRIKLARIHAGYATAEEAASALKVKPSGYRHHEGGYRAPWASLREYVDFYNVSYEWLAHGRGKMEPSSDQHASQAEELLSSLKGDLYVHALDYLRLLKKQQDRTD